MALASKGRIDERKPHFLNCSNRGKPTGRYARGFNSAKDVFAVATATVQARIASAGHHSDEAISLLREAVAREDSLAYELSPRIGSFPCGSCWLRVDGCGTRA